MVQDCRMAEHESLRTKKARQTRTALHEAAITRVLDQGLDAVTVAAIAADAGVSPRTFFNYYQTKEDAIVGLDTSSIDAQLVTDYVESDNGMETLAEDTANFVREALLVGTDPRLSTRRRQLFAAYPELVTKRFEQVEASRSSSPRMCSPGCATSGRSSPVRTRRGEVRGCSPRCAWCRSSTRDAWSSGRPTSLPSRAERRTSTTTPWGSSSRCSTDCDES